MKYIVLLRGINIGGHNVPMERLRKILGGVGLNNVRTYIQTGNVFFESSETNRPKLIKKIEGAILANFGFSAPVSLLTVEEFGQVLQNSPFTKKLPAEDERFCVVFLPQPLSTDTAFPVESPKGGVKIVSANRQAAYVIWKIINGRPPTSVFIDKILGAGSTSRFYHTAEKILAAAR